MFCIITSVKLCVFYFRLAQSESVQFFQFDSEGNMFVFAPGAGCTGEAKLVQPGDELIFSSEESNVGVTWSANGNISVAKCEEFKVFESTQTTEVPDDGAKRHAFKAPLHQNKLKNLSYKKFSD